MVLAKFCALVLLLPCLCRADAASVGMTFGVSQTGEGTVVAAGAAMTAENDFVGVSLEGQHVRAPSQLTLDQGTAGLSLFLDPAFQPTLRVSAARSSDGLLSFGAGAWIRSDLRALWDGTRSTALVLRANLSRHLPASVVPLSTTSLEAGLTQEVSDLLSLGLSFNRYYYLDSGWAVYASDAANLVGEFASALMVGADYSARAHTELRPDEDWAIEVGWSTAAAEGSSFDLMDASLNFAPTSGWTVGAGGSVPVSDFATWSLAFELGFRW